MPVKGTTMSSYRPLMQGVSGMVAASHPSAAMAGLEVLKRGGNAIGTEVFCPYIVQPNRIDQMCKHVGYRSPFQRCSIDSDKPCQCGNVVLLERPSKLGPMYS